MGSNAFFLLLKDAARIDRLEALRQKALATLWDQVRKDENKQEAKGRPSWAPSARSHLPEIFQAEDDAEQSWNTLKGGPTDMRLWDKAAAMRGKIDPEEA